MALEHGVPALVIEAIGAGGEPPFEADDERAIYAVARQLTADGKLDQGAYDAACLLLGDEGMVELVALCGYYTLISYLLNAFDVELPGGATPRWAPGQTGSVRARPGPPPGEARPCAPLAAALRRGR